MNALIEKYTPQGLSIACGISLWVFNSRLSGASWFPAASDILGSSISMGAIFAGFLATAKSMLISMDTPTMSELKRTRFYDLLLDYLGSAIWGSLILCAYCLIGYFVKDRDQQPWFAIIWGMLVVFALASWFRVTRAFLLLMKAR